jgi:hypothetical protein
MEMMNCQIVMIASFFPAGGCLPVFARWLVFIRAKALWAFGAPGWPWWLCPSAAAQAQRHVRKLS